MAAHPYFQKRNPNQGAESTGTAQVSAEGELFWDGFQWVPRQRQKAYFNPMQENMIAKVVEVSGADKTKNMERVANSRTLIVDNVPLDLGMTKKELQKFFLDKLAASGISNLYIIDIDLQAGGQNNSIQVELASQDMVEQFRTLDSTQCLGETLKVRRIGEETTQTNAQAAVIALNALQQITRGGRTKPKGESRGAVNKAELDEGVEPELSEDETGLPGGALGMNAVSLKTLTPSRYVKISNVWNRDFQLTDEARIELETDFTEELHSVTKFKKLTVVTIDMVKLGAELGSIFVEFWNDKTSQQGVRKVKGRIYDGSEIKTCYIEDSLYKEHFFPESTTTTVSVAPVVVVAEDAKIDERPAIITPTAVVELAEDSSIPMTKKVDDEAKAI